MTMSFLIRPLQIEKWSVVVDLGTFLWHPPSLQSGKAAEKTPAKPCDIETYEKKIRLLEKQRKDVSLNWHFLVSAHLLFFCFVPLGTVALPVVFPRAHRSSRFAVLLTGSGGEQAVGHSVELHEVTVWAEGTAMTLQLQWRVWEGLRLLSNTFTV